MADEVLPPRPPPPPTGQVYNIPSLHTQVGVFVEPLPPPEVLKQYNEAFPGCAERIVKMAEDQAHHRQSLERAVIESNVASQKSGMRYGFILCGLALIGGLALLALDKSAAGYTVLLADLTSFAGATIYLRWTQQQERESKLALFQQPATTPSQPQKPLP